MPSVSILIKYPSKPKIYNLYLYLPSDFLIMVYGINLELIYYRFLGNFCFEFRVFFSFPEICAFGERGVEEREEKYEKINVIIKFL